LMSSPPSIFLLFTGIGMIAVAVVSVVLWKRGRAVSWTAFGLGALAWVVSVALKVAWALPVNRLIQRGLDDVLPAWASRPMFWLYIGLLTGIFECGITLLFVKRTRLKTAEWDEAVAFGIGFGAMEAFLLGLLGIIGVLAAIVFWDQHDVDASNALGHPSQSGVIAILLPVVERVSALIAHVVTCVLVVFSVRDAARRWFWLAFAYKTALDAFAAWIALATGMTKSMAGLVTAEASVGAFAVLGLAALAYLRRRFLSLPASDSGAVP
jgi:uncharacterized membrane protein YhfC